MSIQTNGVTNGTTASSSSSSSPSPDKRKLKVLMLHGYTQSGPLFHAKTRAHEKLLQKSFPSTKSSPLHHTYPGGIQLFYPTGPIGLLPADIPGYISPIGDDEGEKIERPEAFGWWKRETGEERYVGLEEGLETIAQTIREAGGIDGVIGFSQGGCAAGFVASLLEEGREEAFEKFESLSSSSSAKDDKADHKPFSYPASFCDLKASIGQGPLKFAVSYSGFVAPSSLYQAFYSPKMSTPFLHVLGSLDSVVEESRSLGLVNSCEEGEKRRVLYHPGGHFVPIGKEMSGALVGFIREHCEVKKVEENVEDMDVPF